MGLPIRGRTHANPVDTHSFSAIKADGRDSVGQRKKGIIRVSFTGTSTHHQAPLPGDSSRCQHPANHQIVNTKAHSIQFPQDNVYLTSNIDLKTNNETNKKKRYSDPS